MREFDQPLSELITHDGLDPVTSAQVAIFEQPVPLALHF
jgi:hypothetical protein